MIPQISPAQFSEWVAHNTQADQTPLMIDVREPGEWQIARIADSASFEQLHVSIGNIPSEMNQLDPDRPTALLCHHGRRSQMVAMFLQQNGFTQLVNIDGGIDAWSVLDPTIPQY